MSEHAANRPWAIAWPFPKFGIFGYDSRMEHPCLDPDAIPGVTDDPVLRLILSGEAKSLHEAEEQFLDAALPQIVELIGSPISNDALARHPWMQLLLAHGSRGWEDSVL